MVLKTCGDGKHLFSVKPEFGESCKCGMMGWGLPEVQAKIVSLSKFRNKKKCDNEIVKYKDIVTKMDKLQLLEEMVRFQEWRSREGKLTGEMILKGIILFDLLVKNAETKELRLLCTSYHRHLQYELNVHNKSLPPIA